MITCSTVLWSKRFGFDFISNENSKMLSNQTEHHPIGVFSFVFLPRMKPTTKKKQTTKNEEEKGWNDSSLPSSTAIEFLRQNATIHYYLLNGWQSNSWYRPNYIEMALIKWRRTIENFKRTWMVSIQMVDNKQMPFVWVVVEIFFLLSFFLFFFPTWTTHLKSSSTE